MKINIDSLCKSYGARDLFRDFTLEINDGNRLAVVGPNGAGKSTLLKMLGGGLAPDSGRVLTPKGARVGYTAQEMNDQDLDKSLLGWVLEVLPSWSDFWREWERAASQKDQAAMDRLGARQAELELIFGHNPEQRAHSVLSGLGFAEAVHLNRLRTFSGGWRERAKLARVLTAGADILLLDEPTNHLDLEAVEWLEGFLGGFPGVVVFVAHDRVFMERVGTHVLFLGREKPLFRKGSFSDFLDWMAENEEQRRREAKRISDELEKKMDFVRRFKAKATKARQAGSKKKQALRLEKELQGLAPEPKKKALSFKWPEPVRSERTVLSVVDLEFSYPGHPPIWPKLGFNIYRGQKIALAGPNGCGKSTLLKLVAGELTPGAGRIERGSSISLGYFSQHQHESLEAEKPVLAQIRSMSDPRTTEEELMSVLGLFMLGQEYFDRPTGSLSGGEKNRLILASLFLKRANFLLLDEPTNHLDLESREALIQALVDFKGTILMVAHDRWLLSSAAEQVWALSPQGIEVHEEGYAGYDKARQAVAEPVGSEDRALDREAARRRKREQAEQRNRIYRQLKPKQAEFEAREKELEELLGQLDEVEKTLADPEVYADARRAETLLKDYARLKAQSDEVVERMEVLEKKIAALEEERAGLGGA